MGWNHQQYGFEWITLPPWRPLDPPTLMEAWRSWGCDMEKTTPKKYVINVFFDFFFPSALDRSSLVDMDYSCCCFFLVHFQKIFVLFWVISGFVTVITLCYSFNRCLIVGMLPAILPNGQSPRSETFRQKPPEKKQGYPFVENPMVWKMILFFL